MDIRLPTLPPTAQPTAKPAADLLAILKPGQTLAAVVEAALDDAFFLLRLESSGRLVRAQSTLALIPGQQLKLEVAATGSPPRLRVLAEPTSTPVETATVTQAFRQFLPKIGSFSELMLPLQQLMQAKSPTLALAAFPEPVRLALQQLLDGLPLRQQLTTPDGLKKAIRQSGLFFEASLAQELAGESDAATTPGTDLKARLLVLIDTLNRAAPDASKPQTETPARGTATPSNTAGTGAALPGEPAAPATRTGAEPIAVAATNSPPAQTPGTANPERSEPTPPATPQPDPQAVEDTTTADGKPPTTTTTTEKPPAAGSDAPRNPGSAPSDSPRSPSNPASATPEQIQRALTADTLANTTTPSQNPPARQPPSADTSAPPTNADPTPEARPPQPASVQAELEPNASMPARQHGADTDLRAAPPTTASASDLNNLLQKAEGALSRVVLDQLASLPQPADPRNVWQFELPFREPPHHGNARLKIVREDAHRPSRTGDNPRWSVVIELNPPGLGTVNCRIGLSGLKVDSWFWATEAATTRLIAQHLDLLAARLSQAGLDVGKLDTLAKPPAESQTDSLRVSAPLLDEKA